MNYEKSILQVDSNRQYNSSCSWQIFYELEDDLAQELDININFLSKRIEFFNKVSAKLKLNRLIKYLIPRQNKYSFTVIMNPSHINRYSNRSKIIPYIIDFWKFHSIEDFNRDFKDCPFVYVASLEAIKYMKESGCTIKLKHLSFSIADKYLKNLNQTIEKDIDIIQIGRKNLKLHQYAMDYCRQHPSINYVHRVIEEDGTMNYYSTKNGLIGSFDNRSDFMESLLLRSKISLTSTPGLESLNGKKKGVNVVSVRVFESVVNQCHILGRYEKNEEYHQFGLDEILHNVVAYDDFKTACSEMLATPAIEIREKYTNFILQHLNSNRAKQINRDILALHNESVKEGLPIPTYPTPMLQRN